jgi:NhaA family Na+:H+ antiporter
MTQGSVSSRLDPLVDDSRDHILGSSSADLTLVEYGSYACPHCRAANEQIARVRDILGDRLRYVFRHRPLTGSELAREAAEVIELIDDPAQFWQAHILLMTRSEHLTRDDVEAVRSRFVAHVPDVDRRRQQARERVASDEQSAHASGVAFTPTFFANGRRYDGPWDHVSLSDALLGSLGHRVRSAALEFASWAPSAGVLLLIATVLAVALTNSAFGEAFNAFWHLEAGLNFGPARFSMSLHHWVNDALLTVFFLVVGLEIKREFTVGHLASMRSAALPVAAALGGMLVPAATYSLLVPGGEWAHGWGVPMATDTAFAIALIAMLGRRVPVGLRIFLTAAAIVDDIGAILVVALFYSGDLSVPWLLAALATTVVLVLLNRVHVYRATPYVILGIVLWACVFAAGLHATLAGVVLAVLIPTRPPPDYLALSTQADAILASEARRGGEILRHGPSEPVLRALDAIHDRLESPADRMLRHTGPRASYLVLPVFALANAGVVITLNELAGREMLMLGIALGLAVGKPVGIILFSALAVRVGIAVKPQEYSWQQLIGAGALAGIGFTMSLFIAGQAFMSSADFAAAKVAVFGGSIVAALSGLLILWFASERESSARERAVAMVAN